MNLLKILFHPTKLWENTGSLERVSGYRITSKNSCGRTTYFAEAYFQPTTNRYSFVIKGFGYSRRKAIDNCRREAHCSDYDSFLGQI